LISPGREAGFRGEYARNSQIRDEWMRRLCKPWDAPRCRFGDVMVVCFLIVQCLDGVFTYLGVRAWGPSIEANPIISSAVGAAGLGTGLMAAKLVAVACGILLHLRRVHNAIAFLTVAYVAAAILPWTALFLVARP
jgi:hypothetical protein